MREMLTNTVEVLLQVRVPLHVEYQLMRDEFIVCWDFERHDELPPPHVFIDFALVDVAQFGRREFDSHEGMIEAMSMRARLAHFVADRIARGGVS